MRDKWLLINVYTPTQTLTTIRDMQVQCIAHIYIYMYMNVNRILYSLKICCIFCELNEISFFWFSPFGFFVCTLNNFIKTQRERERQTPIRIWFGFSWHNQCVSMWILFLLSQIFDLFFLFLVVVFRCYFSVHLHKLFAHSIYVYVYILSGPLSFPLSSAEQQETAISSRSTNRSINTKSAT